MECSFDNINFDSRQHSNSSIFSGRDSIGEIDRIKPIFFITTSSKACHQIRKNLGKNWENPGFLFDCPSNNDRLKRITILLESIPDDVKNLLLNFYGDVISHIDYKTANDMLVRSFLM